MVEVVWRPRGHTFIFFYSFSKIFPVNSSLFCSFFFSYEPLAKVVIPVKTGIQSVT
ncbi:MAG: hypothetical protein L0922_06660 [Candidatus Mariimomonas ferrooxydans]